MKSDRNYCQNYQKNTHTKWLTFFRKWWGTYDVDELYESEIEADVDDVSEVTDGSNERVVTVEQMIHQTNFVVTSQTFQKHRTYT